MFLTSLMMTLVLYGATPALAATSPNLGAADSFAVLGATEVTNVPTSTIKGDVGLSPAAGTNYDGLTVLEVTGGTIYAVDVTGPAGVVGNNPGLLTSAQLANTDAFGALNAGDNAACTTDYGDVVTSLDGLTLGPGVYCSGTFELSGTLTLSGTGVWIFKSGSTLITSGPAKVVGGDPCNVWWRVPSSATIGTNTQLTGNILALTSIGLETGATLNGRALAQTGAVTLDSNTITASACSDQTPPGADIADISGMKFNDSNNNHIKDAGEEGLAGWTITLSKPVSGTTITDITDISGEYSFTGLPPGTYIVSETQKGGWTQTAPVSPGTYTIVLNGVDVTDKDFGNFKTSTPPLPPPQSLSFPHWY
jgi:hypothetical protein